MSATLTTIFLNERRSLIWSVMRIVRDPQTAEDLTQETYVRAISVVDSRPIEHIEAFLYQTAKNLALDYMRRQRTRHRYEPSDREALNLSNVPSDTPSIEAVVIQRERLRQIEDALQILPERARRVWVLARIEGWSYPRIASHLGISQGTVFNDIKRALGHIQDALEKLDRE